MLWLCRCKVPFDRNLVALDDVHVRSPTGRSIPSVPFPYHEVGNVLAPTHTLIMESRLVAFPHGGSLRRIVDTLWKRKIRASIVLTCVIFRAYLLSKCMAFEELSKVQG